MDIDWGLGGIKYEEGVIISLLTNEGKKWLMKVAAPIKSKLFWKKKKKKKGLIG